MSLLLRVESFLGNRLFAQGTRVVVLKPISYALGVEEVPLVTRQRDYLVILSIVHETYGADDFFSLFSFGQSLWLEFCLVKVLDELGGSGHPVGSLLLSRCKEDYRDEQTDDRANATAFQHLKVANNNDDQGEGSQRAAVLHWVLSFVEMHVAKNEPNYQGDQS
jgi:hypothetical protein